MDADRDKQIEPLCKFGPGGDFVSIWPKESIVSSQELPNCLGKLLSSVSKTISTSADSVYLAPTTVTKSNRFVSGEPMLFPDDCRISLRTGHKPKPRIRAYRRTAKKRPAFGSSVQGSLFETDFKGAKTA